MKTANTKNLNVAIYVRFSKDERNDESTSVAHQKDMLTRYVREKEWGRELQKVKVFEDDGFTGTNFQRPAWINLIKDIEDGVVNVVVVKDLSRLGRNYSESGYYTDSYFPEHNIRFIAVNDGIDTKSDYDNDYSNDIIPFKHILNEFHPKETSRKVRSAKKTMAHQGKFANSRAPYGFMKSPLDKHVLLIDENVSDIVKRIYDMFLSGNSGRFIADTFNREGIPTPNAYHYERLRKPNPYKNQSNKWGSGSIMQIIKNPVYYGAMANGKRKVLSFKNKKVIKNPADTWIVVENTHEAIISKSIWDEAQKIVLKNHVGIRRGGSGEVSLFSGVAKCADCGTKMTYNRKVRQTYIDEYYRCGRYTNKGTDACNPHTIVQETIYRAVIEDIKEYAKLACSDERRLTDRLIKDNTQHADKISQRHEKFIREKENRLKEIDGLIQSLFEEKIGGNVPENIFKRMAKKYDDEQLALAEEIKKLTNELSDFKRNENDVALWIAKIKKCVSIEKLTREIVVELIDSIEISEVYEVDGELQQDINITYRFENLKKGKRVS